MFVWYGARVGGVGFGVEEVRKLPLLEFGEAEGRGECLERHLKETRRIDEVEVVFLEFQDFAAIPYLMVLRALAVVGGNHGVTSLKL